MAEIPCSYYELHSDQLNVSYTAMNNICYQNNRPLDVWLDLLSSTGLTGNSYRGGRAKNREQTPFCSLTNNQLVKEWSPSWWFGSMAQMLIIQRTEFPYPYCLNNIILKIIISQIYFYVTCCGFNLVLA